MQGVRPWSRAEATRPPDRSSRTERVRGEGVSQATAFVVPELL